MINRVLTIAGSDCSGGAGVQADIKTITVHKAYAMSVLTALTAQNTTGVYGIVDVDPEFIANQIDCVFTDIVPDSVKTGMLSNAEAIKTITRKLRQYGVKNLVVDPVMAATSGARLLREDAVNALISELLPIARVITPNVPEAEILCGFAVRSANDMERAAEKIANLTSAAILIKGGHCVNDANDLLYENGKFTWFAAKKIENPNTHGTGCTLSAAIACGLAQGKSVSESAEAAKRYLSGALSAGLDLGKGPGPLDHTYALNDGT